MNSRGKLQVNAKDHIQGEPHAPITLIEYGDYECPDCEKAFFMIKKLQRQFKNQIRFVFRHLPRQYIHPHAELAAEAAEAAHAQGKFWEMHDLIFENPKALNLIDLLNRAEKLNLDLDRFATDLENREYSKKISNDFQSGMRNGADRTPTLFINGSLYKGTVELEALANALDRELDEETIRRAI
jgi:protein-disulfide isomerase